MCNTLNLHGIHYACYGRLDICVTPCYYRSEPFENIKIKIKNKRKKEEKKRKKKEKDGNDSFPTGSHKKQILWRLRRESDYPEFLGARDESFVFLHAI